MYTVWIGGTEINDFYLTLEEAQRLASLYVLDGYDDVIIEKVSCDHCGDQSDELKNGLCCRCYRDYKSKNLT